MPEEMQPAGMWTEHPPVGPGCAVERGQTSGLWHAMCECGAYETAWDSEIEVYDTIVMHGLEVHQGHMDERAG